MEKGIDVPGRLGLAGFNAVELIQGLPRRLATMDSCRREIGEAAARIIVERVEGGGEPGQTVELTPKLQLGDTLARRRG